MQMLDVAGLYAWTTCAGHFALVLRGQGSAVRLEYCCWVCWVKSMYADTAARGLWDVKTNHYWGSGSAAWGKDWVSGLPGTARPEHCSELQSAQDQLIGHQWRVCIRKWKLSVTPAWLDGRFPASSSNRVSLRLSMRSVPAPDQQACAVLAAAAKAVWLYLSSASRAARRSVAG